MTVNLTNKLTVREFNFVIGIPMVWTITGFLNEEGHYLSDHNNLDVESSDPVCDDSRYLDTPG